MNKNCKVCDTKKTADKDSDEYKAWFAEHSSHCGKNYDGSAPAMEPAGVKNIFGRFIDKRGLR